jgi:hypothetical protein
MEPVMDLNYLYQRYQVSLYRSEHAACARSRRAHLEFATAYGSLISGWKTRCGPAASA